MFIAICFDPQILWISLSLFSKACLNKIPQLLRTFLKSSIFLKSHICNTSCIKIHTLFAISNNKELWNFKVRQIYSVLGIDDG